MRHWLALQATFAMELHLNPLLVSLQEPGRFSPVWHVMLLHVSHVPGLANPI